MPPVASLRLRLLCLTLALASAACVLHLGGDDDAPCHGGGPEPAADVAVTLLLDPSTLTCVDFTSSCNACGDCTEPAAFPSWGPCQSHCSGLSELACFETVGCRAAFDHACWSGDGPCTALEPFIGCFAIDTTGPAAGSCVGLDAFACSRHDDCLATYRDSGACDDGRDDDGDGQVDENDECRRFGECQPEAR